MENEMGKLYEAAAIFEINVPDFKQMKQCRKEVGGDLFGGRSRR